MNKLNANLSEIILRVIGKKYIKSYGEMFAIRKKNAKQEFITRNTQF